MECCRYDVVSLCVSLTVPQEENVKTLQQAIKFLTKKEQQKRRRMACNNIFGISPKKWSCKLLIIKYKLPLLNSLVKSYLYN